ncbi:amino acid transporter [Polychaeton citri CBS 116435]|uniref:Amino acid transporter n=1 Tax=Polychaeton citri CBS 116435 TaxID=1314669 RepID=A0A9P4Q561_9PEZI|nr:amino acid transporter [Polychaeton citri CBS 116435]
MSSNAQKSADVELSAYGEPVKQESYNDESDMRRMGKKQDFNRNFQFLSIAAFSVVAISGWCYVPSTSTTAIANGGTGGLIIIFLSNWAGLTFVVLSLAEMSSIAPTAGGQYHWASEFAPPSIQKVVSYIAGWLSSLSWLCGTSGAMFLTGTTMQGLIVATNPSYVPQPWQGYLFVVMIASAGVLVNTVLARYLPRLEGIMFIIFTMAFMAFMVVLWVLAPRLTTTEVFQTIQKGSGWGTLGLSLLASQSAVMFLLVGSDATAHMAEETKKASVVVPKAMITSYVVNGGLGFIMTVTFCFLLVDYDNAENSPVGMIGLPFIQVFINAVGSVGGGTAMVAILCVIQTFGCINWMASNARQIFAFARDQGLPFSGWIAKVNMAGTYPVNSILFVWAFVVLISLITLGSTIAFDAIVSLQILALIFTYLVSLSCLIWRRLFGEPLPASPWTLGRFGLPINVVGICYCVYLIIFLPWPIEVPVTAENFNWAPVMFVGIMILSALYYILWARKIYKGPVFLVRPRED